MDESFSSLTAGELAELLRSATLKYESIRDLIEDECESSEDFDSHEKASEARAALQNLRNVEQVIKRSLQIDVDGHLRQQLDAIALLDVLSEKPSPLLQILKKTKK